MITRKVLGEKYIIDGVAIDTAGYTPDMSADIYYEVIRLMDGKFLFLKDHLKRFQNSLSGSWLDYPGSDVIIENLKLLQISNNVTFGNIRICMYRNTDNGISLICYFVPYFYPEEYMYKSGVKLVTYPHVRPNPGIKKWDDRFRISVSEYIQDQCVYEAILLNNQNQITEGSRSNIFFVDTNYKLITAPEGSVLPGITRKYVLNICSEEGIEVIHKPVQLDDLSGISSCFISGTSPKILPVSQLNGFQFNVDHPVLHLLMERFESLIKENLTSII